MNILREKIRRALPKAKKAVLVMGLPGSGKSTAARGLDSRTSLVIDTCALTALHRRTIIALAKAARVPIDCCVVATDAATCAQRRPHISSAEFARLNAQYQPPGKREGFRRLWYTQRHGTKNNTKR